MWKSIIFFIISINLNGHQIIFNENISVSDNEIFINLWQPCTFFKLYLKIFMFSREFSIHAPLGKLP